jgi:hypothetical protein
MFAGNHSEWASFKVYFLVRSILGNETEYGRVLFSCVFTEIFLNDFQLNELLCAFIIHCVPPELNVELLPILTIVDSHRLLSWTLLLIDLDVEE